MANNKMEVHRKNAENWKVTLVDSGENTMTGGRIKRVKQYLNNETFCLTYGDGVSDINVKASIDFHKKQNSIVTLTGVQMPGRFGAFTLAENNYKISTFREKPTGDGHEDAWINGGFFIVEPEALDFIEDNSTVWERDPLEALAKKNKLSAFKHRGFWQPMDTLRDKHVLEDMWNSGKAPWKLW